MGAVEGAHAGQTVARDERHDGLVAAGGIAGGRAGKGVDVLVPLARAQPRRGAAHALVQRDADAGRLALERAEHQFPAVEAIESRPVEVGHRLPDQRRDIGHVKSEEHTFELQSLMRISYAVFCLKKKTTMHKQVYYTSDTN